MPISLSVVYSRQTPEVVEPLTWALSNGHVVDVDVQFTADDKSYDSLEEFLSAASKDANPESTIVICSCAVRVQTFQPLIFFHHSECVTASGRFVPASRKTSHPPDVQGISSPRSVVIADPQHLCQIPPAELARVHTPNPRADWWHQARGQLREERVEAADQDVR